MVGIQLTDGTIRQFDLIETARGLRVCSRFSYHDLDKLLMDLDWHIVMAEEPDRAVLTRHGVSFAAP